MLDKRLKLGGMQVGGPRTIQNAARFRVASNVYQTRDNLYVPRNGCSTNNKVIDGDGLLASTFYKGKVFHITYAFGGATINFTYDLSLILSTPVSLSQSFNPDITLFNDGIQFSENLGCLYIHIPQFGLYKFDGTHIFRAGVPMPYFNAPTNPSGTTYIRVVQHHIDYQGNIVNSGYIDFRATPTGTSGQESINFRVDKGGVDSLPFSLNLIKKRQSYDVPTLQLGYDSYFFTAVSFTYDNTLKEITVTTGGDHDVVEGAYLMTAPYYNPSNPAPNIGQYRGIAFRVKSFTATTVVMDMNAVKILDENFRWREQDILIANSSDIGAFFPYQYGTIEGGTNYYFSVWCSDQQTGVYVYRGLCPCFYDSNQNHTKSVIITTNPTQILTGLRPDYTAFNLVQNLGEIYDVTSLKTVFPFGEDSVAPPKSYTNYQGMALIAYDNEVFFTDTTLGGSFEMTNGVAFIVVGEGYEEGIQSICGNSEFLLVSRKLKNYYVSGNLPTAGYRIQAISGPTIGCYSNESSISVEDKIIFLTKQGVFALYYGARCDEVSENIKEIFETYSVVTDRQEELFFNLNFLPNFSTDVIGERKWLKIRWDSFRNLLVFLKGDEQLLVLNMNNGEFYAWDKMTDNEHTLGHRTDDICFYQGRYYLGAFWLDVTPTSIQQLTEVYGDWYYQRTSNSVFQSTWMTNGEPSLEKKGCQLKLWGLIEGKFDIKYYVDFKETAESEVYEYQNSESFKMSHKQQVNPTNFLAWSYEVRLKGFVSKFELEGAEVEYTPQQAGMKR